MSWLLALFPGKAWIYAAVLAASFAAGGTGAWWAQGLRLDKVKAEYKGFVDVTKAFGEAAQTAADEKIRLDKAAKRMADDENKRTLDNLRADNKRLRDARAGSSYLPAAAASSPSPATATIDRAEFERSMGDLDQGVQALVDKGDTAVVDLNTAKIWAAK